jgi:hypothetical protein
MEINAYRSVQVMENARNILERHCSVRVKSWKRALIPSVFGPAHDHPFWEQCMRYSGTAADLHIPAHGVTM